MPRVRLYLDEDAVQLGLVAALRARRVDVITAVEARMSGKADEQHLRWATNDRRALYSFNIRDYARIHQALITSGESHAGIIVAPQQRYSAGDQARRLLRLLNKRSESDMKNRLEYLSAWGY